MVNEWTIDDLPTKFDDSRFPRHPWNPSPELMADLAVWLNEHHPKPEPDRLRRAHEIVEQERDQARERAVAYARCATQASLDRDQARAERDEAWRVAGEQTRLERDRAEAAERERDEWKARAEKAEGIIPDYVMLDVWGALGRDSSQFDYWRYSHGYAGAGAWAKLVCDVRTRAEAAEARTAVTREEVEKALYGVYAAHGNWAVTDEMADAVCALFGVEAEPADQVEQKAAELYEAAWPNSSPWGSPTIVNPDQYRRMARRVLGQEDRHVDQ